MNSLTSLIFYLGTVAAFGSGDGQKDIKNSDDEDLSESSGDYIETTVVPGGDFNSDSETQIGDMTLYLYVGCGVGAAVLACAVITWFCCKKKDEGEYKPGKQMA